MRLLTHKLAICALAMLLASCASGNGANSGGIPRTTPQPTGSVYTSKLGNFTCKVPYLWRPGAYQMERGDADSAEVMYYDDFGHLLRIESERMPKEFAPRFDSPDGLKTLDDFFDRSVFPLAFRSISLQANVMHRDHVTTAAGPAVFVVVSVPQGSSLASVDEQGGLHRADSVRGVLIFVKRGFIYVIMNQEPGGNNIDHGPLDQRITLLLDTLQQTIAGMTFQEH